MIWAKIYYRSLRDCAVYHYSSFRVRGFDYGCTGCENDDDAVSDSLVILGSHGADDEECNIVVTEGATSGEGGASLSSETEDVQSQAARRLMRRSSCYWERNMLCSLQWAKGLAMMTHCLPRRHVSTWRPSKLAACFSSTPKTVGFPVGYGLNKTGLGVVSISEHVQVEISSGEMGIVSQTCGVRFEKKLCMDWIVCVPRRCVR